MSYKIDDLGTYNDEHIPSGISFPLGLSEENSAIVSADNVVILRYGATNETAVLFQEKRKAEFIAKMANGNLIVLKDKSGNDRVFRRIKREVGKNGNVIVEFEEVKILTAAA